MNLSGLLGHVKFHAKKVRSDLCRNASNSVVVQIELLQGCQEAYLLRNAENAVITSI